MNEILQSVLDNNFVVFNEKFKDKLKTKYNTNVETIRTDFNKTVFNETMKINDGSKVVKCKSCGKTLIPSIPIMGACPFCGELLTQD